MAGISKRGQKTVNQIKCPNCQHGNQTKAKYCSECGASLIFKCPLCNSETPLGSKFCSGCGKGISKILAGIKEAKTKRGSAERELVYEFNSKPRNPFSIVDQITKTQGSARITLDIDEYVARKEGGVTFYRGDTYRKEADGYLYLTNKRLIFLGRDSEFGISSFEIPYSLDEISEAKVQSDKALFLSSTYLRIVWNGNVRKFSFSREDITASWVESVSTRINGNSPTSEYAESDLFKCKKCGLPFKTKEGLNAHRANWHK